MNKTRTAQAVHRVVARLDELEQENARLQARVASLEPRPVTASQGAMPAHAAQADEPPDRLSRRGAMGAALGAAATAVAGTLFAAGPETARADGVEGPTTFRSTTTGVPAVTALATTNAVSGASTLGSGLAGAGRTGVMGTSTNGYGGYFRGGAAPLCLTPASTVGPPSSGAHAQGELYVDAIGTAFTCAVAGSPGRWVSLSNPVIDVRAFGVQGDGAADDTAAIQAALTAAGATGGTVYFPPGTYRVTSHLFVTGMTNLLGAGGATLELAAALTYHDPVGGAGSAAGTYCWINLGIRSYGDNDNQGGITTRWPGRIAGLRFTVAPVAATGYLAPQSSSLVLLACHNCERYVIEDNYFDFADYGAQLPAPLSIWAANNPWCPTPWRLRGMLRGIGSWRLRTRTGPKASITPMPPT